jgi:hypothetical protein
MLNVNLVELEFSFSAHHWSSEMDKYLRKTTLYKKVDFYCWTPFISDVDCKWGYSQLQSVDPSSLAYALKWPVASYVLPRMGALPCQFSSVVSCCHTAKYAVWWLRLWKTHARDMRVKIKDTLKQKSVLFVNISALTLSLTPTLTASAPARYIAIFIQSPRIWLRWNIDIFNVEVDEEKPHAPHAEEVRGMTACHHW